MAFCYSNLRVTNMPWLWLLHISVQPSLRNVVHWEIIHYIQYQISLLLLQYISRFPDATLDFLPILSTLKRYERIWEESLLLVSWVTQWQARMLKFMGQICLLELYRKHIKSCSTVFMSNERHNFSGWKGSTQYMKIVTSEYWLYKLSEEKSKHTQQITHKKIIIILHTLTYTNLGIRIRGQKTIKQCF